MRLKNRGIGREAAEYQVHLSVILTHAPDTLNTEQCAFIPSDAVIGFLIPQSCCFGHIPTKEIAFCLHKFFSLLFQFKLYSFPSFPVLKLSGKVILRY